MPRAYKIFSFYCSSVEWGSFVCADVTHRKALPVNIYDADLDPIDSRDSDHLAWWNVA